MDGLDQTRRQERTLPALTAEVDDAIAQAGRNDSILAPVADPLVTAAIADRQRPETELDRISSRYRFLLKQQPSG